MIRTSSFGANINNSKESVLGKKYDGLRPSSSIYDGPDILLDSTANTINFEGLIESAPITTEDIPLILQVLEPCPTGSYALRVFQQHPEGLCWQDSLFIMLYNQDWFRPFLMETAVFYLEEFLRRGHTNLTYGVKKTRTEKNNSKWTFGMKNENLPNIIIEYKSLEEKIVPIAAKLAEHYAAMELPLKFWEYYSLELHRYILLAYLFLKYPDTATLSQPMTKTTPLMSRRKSISAANYGKLALNFKEYVFRMFEVGMYCSNFKEGRRWFEILTKAVSRNSVSLVDYETKSVIPGDILGYYIIIHSSSSNAKHVVSLFKCRDLWFLYDIDVGLVEFSQEKSVFLESSKLKNLVIENNKERGVFEYTISLEDGKILQSELPSQLQYNYKLDKFLGNMSMILVRGDISANSVKTNNKPPAGFYGGRRYRKTRRRSTRRNRKHK